MSSNCTCEQLVKGRICLKYIVGRSYFSKIEFIFSLFFEFQKTKLLRKGLKPPTSTTKYCGKQIFSLGKFPKVGQNKRRKKKRKRKKDRKLVITIASYTLQRHLRWCMQAAWANIILGSFPFQISP